MARYAVLSDIHGNLPALEAVIADARAMGADAWLNLGDILSGPLWPAETAALLATLDAPAIAGNHERQVLTLPRERMGPSDRFAAERLSEATLRWLASLPPTRWAEPGLWCVHGTPTSDLQYLLETVTKDFGIAGSAGVRQATDDEIAGRLGFAHAEVVLCGHSHMPRDLVVGGVRLVNPGSVGLPAFDWDQPHLHHMETGTPHSRYAVVERKADGWQVELRRVAYDHEPVARRAEANGRGDWADALRTGRVGRREDEVVA
jgi:predicted phosphodiesterase